MDKVLKYKKQISIALGILLIIPMFLAARETGYAGEEVRIATELSNVTGASVERILELRGIGRSWDQVLNMLEADSDNKGEKKRRSEDILNSAVGKDYIKGLKKEGYTEKEIIEAKMLAERVEFQLKEITKENSINENTTTIDPKENGLEEEKKDLTNYNSLKEKLDIEKAVYLMLKLKDEFGSIEEVLDEYLLSLQLELDLENYLIDKEGYLEEKEKKSIGLNSGEIVTLMTIEEKMIERIQVENKDNMDSSLIETKGDESIIGGEGDNNPTINVPNPNLESVKPVNPTNEIMKEIESINPNGN